MNTRDITSLEPTLRFIAAPICAKHPHLIEDVIQDVYELVLSKKSTENYDFSKEELQIICKEKARHLVNAERKAPTSTFREVSYNNDSRDYLWNKIPQYDSNNIDRTKEFEQIKNYKLKWADFESAKDYIQAFELRSITEWKNFRLTADMPNNIPGTPDAYGVCICLRKDKEFRTMQGGINKITVQGYDSTLRFKTDKVTLLWVAWAVGNEYRIQFTKNETTRRFLVKEEGISATGNIILYETIVEPSRL